MDTERTPAAFMSYVAFSDEAEQARLEQLWQQLAADVRDRTGMELRIFHERDEDWRHNWQTRLAETHRTQEDTTFLIPVITPRYFDSNICLGELQMFLNLEQQLGRDDLIIPIYYLDTPSLEDRIVRESDPYVRAIREHAYVDWRHLHAADSSSSDVLVKVHRMAKRMEDSLIRGQAILPAADIHLPSPSPRLPFSLDEPEPEHQTSQARTGAKASSTSRSRKMLATWQRLPLFVQALAAVVLLLLVVAVVVSIPGVVGTEQPAASEGADAALETPAPEEGAPPAEGEAPAEGAGEPEAPPEEFAPPPPPERVVFVSERDGNPELYAINPDGSAPTRLTNDGASDTNPSWSPDGTRIAFQSNRANNWDIWVVNADGSNPVNLTNEPAGYIDPAWSPDGSRIAFTSDRGGARDIWLMNADGSGLVNLTNGGENYEPAWSPDGARIAFTSVREGNVDIYIIDALTGQNLRRLTFDPQNDITPAWSPDGQNIAFASWRDGDAEIYVLPRTAENDSAPAQLTNNDTNDRDPVWLPNGQAVAFGSGLGAARNILVVNIDGSSLRNLTTSPAPDYAPDWVP